MVRVSGYIRAAPGGNFINVRPHERKKGRYRADMSFTYEGAAQVSIYDRETGGYRALFVGSPNVARDIVRAINDGAVKPRAGFLR